MPDPLADLGVTLTAKGGRLNLWSKNATSMDLCLFDAKDPNWVVKTLPMTLGDAGVWSVTSKFLKPGVRYSVRANGPTALGNAFNPELNLIDPYARGLARTPNGDWRGYVQEPDTFDWGTSRTTSRILARM